MGLKKYEIITVGSDKRVRALRSWQVGDRYVNIGDVGGIVYDEKTLSQDGACWLFRGNFGFPGARIGGDSIVDVGEATLSANGSPAVDILGSSVVVGSKLLFEAEKTAEDVMVLTANDFEQGDYAFVAGAKSENQKVNSPSVVRIKSPIFMGGVSKTFKINVPGYAVQAFGLDADLVMVSATAKTVTGAGVTLSVPAAQYCLIRLMKDPISATVPANATTAAITFTGTYETKLSIVDSRVEINPVTSAGTSSIKPGGRVVNGSYPEAIIRNSKMSVNASAAAGATVRLMGQIIESNVTINATAAEEQISGIYSNVKNLTASGSLSVGLGSPSYNAIQATDCDNFVTSPGVFPGYAAGILDNMPFIFQGCNVPDGRFYHHAQIANTYKNIDFALAQADLGKATANVNIVLASAEVEGMYRIYHKATNLWGPLTETLDSVISIKFLGGNPSKGYETTIYKDAYFNGEFDFAGTNVFGNKVSSHPLVQVLNVAPRAVQGNFNTATVGQTITGVIPSDIRVCIPTPFRINGVNGLKIEGLSATLEALVIFVTPSNVVTAVASSSSGVFPFPAARLNAYAAYIRFSKTGGAAITPEDLAGVTVTVYNGCKIVNTGATAVNMGGNIRVEDNATLIDTSVTGTGYFGGNSIAQGLVAEGLVYMKDNAVFAPTITGTPKANILRMTDNASFTGSWSGAGTRLTMSDNARYGSSTALNTLGVVEMRGNADISGSGTVSVSGVLVLKDDASIAGGNASVSGNITLGGKYRQTASKVWAGKRVIENENEPIYSNNVKTKYDF